MGNLDCTDHEDVADRIEAPPTLALHQVLSIFLLCFEAAIYSPRFWPPAPSTTREVPSSMVPSNVRGLKVWEFRRDHDVSTTGDLDDVDNLPAGYPEVYHADRKANLCDHFCLLLDAGLRRKLQELHLGTCRWVRFPPIVHAIYAEIMPRDGPRAHLEALRGFAPLEHSVLEITTNSGEELIFDGTGEQFGWNAAGWMIDKADIIRNYVKGQSEMVETPAHEKEAEKQRILDSHHGMWKLVLEKMEELLEELDWHGFRGLEDEEIRTRVREQARQKFEGCFGS